MSKILNRYKAYLKLLEKLDVALNSLDVIEAENIIFIKTEKATYEENIIAQLELAGIEAELEGTKKALGSIKSMLEKPDLAEDVQKKLSGYLQKKENDIRQLTEKIEQYRMKKIRTEKELPWKYGGALLSTRYLLERGAVLEKFFRHMDKYKQFLIINKQLIKSVGELRTELISATEKERMDAIAWSKKNIFPLQRKVFKKNHEKYSSSFFGNLQESYGKTCMAYAHFLVKKDLIDKAEQGKISLGELEKLVEIKKEEQASFPLLSFFKKAHDCESFNGSVRKHPLS